MISLQTLPALVLWAVVVIRLIGLPFGWRMGILPAVSMVALGATLNIDQVYLAVDPLLGGWNLLNLIVHLLMGAGMTELSRLLLQATGRSSRRHVKLLIGMGLVLALVQAALLLVSDTQGSAVNFTDTFAASPTAALYLATFFAWIGIVLGYTGLECLRRDRSGESRSFVIGFNIVSVGCLTGVTAVVVKMLLIGMELFGAGVGSGLYVGYRVLIAMTILCFAVGFILPSYGRIKAAFAARRRRLDDLEVLQPIVVRLAKTPEGKRSMDAAHTSFKGSSSTAQLYRAFILIGDIRLLDPDLLSEHETQIINEMGRKFEHNNGASTARQTASGA
jgi:hypothetical protein